MLNTRSGQISKRLPRFGLMIVASFFLYGCTGGLSCGGNNEEAAGCGGRTFFPNDDRIGTEQVENGIRARMTQQALSFVTDNIGELLTNGLLEDVIDVSEGWIRVNLADDGPIVVSDASYAELTFGQDPSDEREKYGFELLIGQEAFTENFRLEFVEAGDRIELQARDENGGPIFVTATSSGIFVELLELPLGIDTRAYVRSSFQGIPLESFACNIFGANDSICTPENPNCGAVTRASTAAFVYPEVLEGPSCRLGGGECINIFVDFQRVDIDIDNTSIEIEQPTSCEVTPNDPDCTWLCTDGLFGGYPNNECNTLCNATDFAADGITFVLGFMTERFQQFMDDALETAVRRGLRNLNGSPLSAAFRVNLRESVPEIFAEDTHDLAIGINPTGDAFAVNCPDGQCDEAKGMDLVLKAGFAAVKDRDPNLAEGQNETLVSAVHPCVPEITTQKFQELYGSLVFDAARIQSLNGLADGEPYAFGASLTDSALNQAFYAAYNAGAFCLEVDTDNLYRLTNGSAIVNTRLLDTFFPTADVRRFTDSDAPVLVSIQPSEPPVIALGSGSGADPHLNFSWRNVQLSLYYMIFDRYSRVVSMTTDITTGLNFVQDPENPSVLVLSIDQSPQLSNIQQTYNELFDNTDSNGNPIVDFPGTLRELLADFLSGVIEGNFAIDIDISDALTNLIGVETPIVLKDIERVSRNESEFLNLYLAFEGDLQGAAYAPSTPISYMAGREMTALQNRHRLDVSDALLRETFDSRLHEADEILLRKNGGAWLGPKTLDEWKEEGLGVMDATQLQKIDAYVVDRPGLGIRHRVLGGQLQSARPDIRFTKRDQILRVDAIDYAETDEFQWRFDDGVWHHRQTTTLDVNDLEDVEEVFVRRVNDNGVSILRSFRL